MCGCVCSHLFRINVDIYDEHTELQEYREQFEALGFIPRDIQQLWAAFDDIKQTDATTIFLPSFLQSVGVPMTPFIAR